MCICDIGRGDQKQTFIVHFRPGIIKTLSTLSVLMVVTARATDVCHRWAYMKITGVVNYTCTKPKARYVIDQLSDMIIGTDSYNNDVPKQRRFNSVSAICWKVF